MIFIGIDVASQKHDIIIIDDYGEIIKDHFTINNDLQGFKKLHTEIKSCMKSINDIHIGMEETGIYHENIRNYLVSHKYTVYTINPILTSYSRKASSPRRTKTDKIDATAICRYIMNNYRSLHSYTKSLYHLKELKSLSRVYLDKKKNLSKVKSELKRLLQMSFPEFSKHFDPFSKWGLSFLTDYPTTSHISKLHIKTIVMRLRTSGDRYPQAKQLKLLAKDSIGQKGSWIEYLLKTNIEDIHHYSKQIELLKSELSRVMINFPNITSIPGVGPITGAIILGEIGDIHRFSNKRQLYAFSGMDPVVHESGKYKLKNSSISKRGSSHFRTAVYTSTKMAIIGKGPDNKFRRKYYNMIKTKHFNTTICAISKNLVHTIFSILTNNTTYIDTI